MRWVTSLKVNLGYSLLAQCSYCCSRNLRSACYNNNIIKVSELHAENVTWGEGRK